MYAYEVWSFFHEGFGLPDGLNWNQIDPDLSKTVLQMERFYNNNFSYNKVITDYLEGIIEHLKVGFNMKRVAKR